MASILGLSSSSAMASSSDLLHAVQSWEDAQRARKAMAQRGDDDMAAFLAVAEKEAAKRVNKMLRRHALWSWLEEHKAPRGIHVARIIALIGDPRRFPGQKCSKGHTSLPDYSVGSPCPVADMKTGELCDGIMEPPRRTTGVRSLRHYLGLHCGPDGKMPRRRKGVKADWNPRGRTSCLQPQGIADQILMHNIKPYRSIYDAARERLSQRGADAAIEVETYRGPEDGDGAADIPDESESWDGRLRPIQIHKTARMIAARTFVEDMFMEWKRLAEWEGEIEARPGEELDTSATLVA